ncbi:hypothetical protein [Vreelandella zhaodongensis]|uniref:hypothetical protein n=1 Tax=Vreelandella zhaodongensis TaxID=1176240 RepID=UPI003EBDE271
MIILSGGVDGALGAGVSTQLAPQVLEALQDSGLPQAAQDNLAMLMAATAGSVVGGQEGAAAGYNEAANNAAKAVALCRVTPACASALSGVLGGSAATAMLNDEIVLTGNEETDLLAAIAMQRAAEAALFVSDLAGGERTEYPAETEQLPISTESPAQPIDRPGRYDPPIVEQDGWATELPVTGPAYNDQVSEGGYQILDPETQSLIGGAVYSESGETVTTSSVIRTYSDGTFSVSDWAGYPADVPRPPEEATYRLLSGAEYAEARKQANNANASLRRVGVVPEGHEIHEIIPVKYGGSPTDLSNKVFLPRSVHRSEVTPWWNRLQRNLK